VHKHLNFPSPINHSYTTIWPGDRSVCDGNVYLVRNGSILKSLKFIAYIDDFLAIICPFLGQYKKQAPDIPIVGNGYHSKIFGNGTQ